MTHLTNKREAPVSAVGVSGMLAHRASFARYVKDITRFSKDCCLSVCTRLYRYVHTELLLRTKAL
jgi:hypothetical protein